MTDSRIPRDWTMIESPENAQHDRCIDIFRRQDGTYGFEEFRRDVEDRGRWTPVSYFSGMIFVSRDAALQAAKQSVAWFD